MTRTAGTLGPYLERLRSLPGVSAVAPAVDGLAVVTSAGKTSYRLEVVTSNLSHAVAEDLVQRLARGASRRRTLVLAPHVSGPMGQLLAEHAVDYLDRAGNCQLHLGRGFVHVAGKTPPRRMSTNKALRAPGYHVLFALLADPALANAPVRALADAAGVSRQPAWELLRRLDEQRALVETRAGRSWLPGKQRDALQRWLVGYETTVRPHLFVAELQTADETPTDLEQRLAPILDRRAPGWRFGGAAAGFRLTHYYRGARTVVHLPAGVTVDPKALRALPRASGGNLTLLQGIGEIGAKGATPDTVHPLLVYSELLVGTDARERESAAGIAERYLGGLA